MTAIGPSLAFYIKHWHAMEHYDYDDERLNLLQVPGYDVATLIEQVDEQAYIEAREFFDELGQRIERVFRDLGCRVKRIRWRGSTWSARWYLWRARTRSTKTSKLWAGITLQEGRDGVVTLYFWLWTAGGHRGEERLAKILDGRVEARSADIGYEPGTVAIGLLPVSSKFDGAFNVPTEPLLNWAEKLARKITKDDMDKILALHD